MLSNTDGSLAQLAIQGALIAKYVLVFTMLAQELWTTETKEVFKLGTSWLAC